MKTSWENKTIGQLSIKKDAVVSGPFGSNLKVSDYKNEGIPILRLQNIGKGYFIEKSIKYISEEKANELKYHSFEPGDIALAKLGIPIGKTCIIPSSFEAGIITADIVRIRPDSHIANYKYVEYYLNTDFSVLQLTGNIVGATRPRVNLSDVRNITIPLPPLPEQQRIVAILDEAFAAIDKAKANAEKNLKNAKELFESYLEGVFENKGDGWQEKSLGEVCDFENGDRGKNYPNKSHRVEFGIPFINAGHLNDNEIDYKEMDYISEQRFNMLGNGKIKPNDLLFCLRGSLGKVANVGKLNKGAIASSLVILRVRKQLDNDYFLYFLNSKLTTNQIVDFGNGAAQPNLSAGSLKKFKIPIPTSISNQQKIVQQLNSLSAETKRLESIYQQKLTDLEELKKSILQKAFNGELNTADICV